MLYNVNLLMTKRRSEGGFLLGRLKKLGDFIRQTRQNAGLTVDQLVEKTGLDRRFIYRVEAGMNNSLYVEKLVAIAIGLQIPFAPLLLMYVLDVAGEEKLNLSDLYFDAQQMNSLVFYLMQKPETADVKFRAQSDSEKILNFKTQLNKKNEAQEEVESGE